MWRRHFLFVPIIIKKIKIKIIPVEKCKIKQLGRLTFFFLIRELLRVFVICASRCRSVGFRIISVHTWSSVGSRTPPKLRFNKFRWLSCWDSELANGVSICYGFFFFFFFFGGGGPYVILFGDFGPFEPGWGTPSMVGLGGRNQPPIVVVM